MLWLVLGRRHPGRARRQRAPGPSAGGAGLCASSGEERRARRRGSRGSAADEPAARGLDRPTGSTRATGSGPPPRKAGRASHQSEEPGPRRAGRGRGAGGDERRVRTGRLEAARPHRVGHHPAGPRRLRPPVDRHARLRDRHLHPPHPGPAAPRPRVSRGTDHSRDRADPGRGAGRRDRRHLPVRPARAADQLGRADPAPPRVRHHRVPRAHHQDGMWRPRPRPPCPWLGRSS